MSDNEVVMTVKTDDLAPQREMAKIVISCSILGKPVHIHVEFKTPLPLDEMPSTVVQDEDQILQDLEAQIWVNKRDDVPVIPRIKRDDEEECAIIEEDFGEESESEE